MVDVADFEAQLASGEDAILPLELQFDRQWARALLAHARAVLREEYTRLGQEALFGTLEPFLDPGAVAPPMTELERVLERNEGAIKVAVHRLRGRFRDVLRREVGCTVATVAEIDDELRHLRDVLACETSA
jgi:RNA polymerase sigma-70 factor (ECF subfamily)